MELLSNLQKLISRDNKYSNLSAEEKAFINAYQKTLRSNVSPDELERARNKMNSLGLSPKQQSKLKDMTMEDYNKKEKVKEAMSGQNKGGLIKPKMMGGGMAQGKKHMYVAGGSVTDKRKKK